MRFVIVTGMSGAGKSTALNRLEDMAGPEKVRGFGLFLRGQPADLADFQICGDGVHTGK